LRTLWIRPIVRIPRKLVAFVPDEETVGKELENLDATKEHLKLLWIACGEDDFLLARNKTFIECQKRKTSKTNGI